MTKDKVIKVLKAIEHLDEETKGYLLDTIRRKEDADGLIYLQRFIDEFDRGSSVDSIVLAVICPLVSELGRALSEHAESGVSSVGKTHEIALGVLIKYITGLKEAKPKESSPTIN